MKVKLPKVLYVLISDSEDIDETGVEGTYVTKKVAKDAKDVFYNEDEGIRLGKYALVEEIAPKKSKK